jgi:hypothetical protein
MFVAAMTEIAQVPKRSAYDLVRDAVVGMGERHGVQAAARAAIDAHPHQTGQHRESPAGLNPMKETIAIDCDAFRIKDAHGAARLCFDALKLYETGYFSPKGVVASVARRAMDRVDRMITRLKS